MSAFLGVVLLSGTLVHGSGAYEVPYSIRMASSIISRNQGIYTGAGGASELLQAGLTQTAFRQLVQHYPYLETSADSRDYVTKSVNSVLAPLGNASQDVSYPLDRLLNGNALVEYSRFPQNNSYMDTVTALRTSIDIQPRNPIGGIWYYVYPDLSYLDGMYSLIPFYTRYTNTYEIKNRTAYDDILYQLDLMENRCHDNSTGLLVHGYDYSKTRVWANSITGASPHVWGRSLGWYMMSLVDTLEILPQWQLLHKWENLRRKFELLSRSVMHAADPITGAWWQVLDRPGDKGNYIESSGSAMLVYALLKGERLGYTSGMKDAGTRAYGYITQTFVVDNKNGTLGYNGTVSVCSLNSTASYEYYVNQPLLYNSVLGSASFVLASLEYESLNH